MFQLDQHHVVLSKLTTRTEKHGEDDVPAASLRIVATAHSAKLDDFSPALRKTFFCKPRVGDQQRIPLESGDDRTSITMPEVKEISWDAEYPGYSLSLGVDLEASDPVLLKGVTVSKCHFEFIDGGSVRIAFSVACTPDGDQVADLYEWQGKELVLTLTPPAASQQKAA